MKPSRYIITLAIVAILGLGIGYYLTPKPEPLEKEPIDYWSKAYKPIIDSLYLRLEEIKHDTRGYSNIKPQITYIYLPSNPLPPQKVTCNTDSLFLVIDSLKNYNLKIPISFLTLFPKNPKLVSMNLSQDSLSWDFLFPDGSTKKEYYPMDFSNYRYLYLDQNLKAQKLDKKLKKAAFDNAKSNLYINSGMISYTQSPFIELQYEFHHKRLKIDTRGSYLIKPNLPIISIGLGYRLK